jgi:hypothetical protein
MPQKKGINPIIIIAILITIILILNTGLGRKGTPPTQFAFGKTGSENTAYGAGCRINTVENHGPHYNVGSGMTIGFNNDKIFTFSYQLMEVWDYCRSDSTWCSPRCSWIYDSRGGNMRNLELHITDNEGNTYAVGERDNYVSYNCGDAYGLGNKTIEEHRAAGGYLLSDAYQEMFNRPLPPKTLMINHSGISYKMYGVWSYNYYNSLNCGGLKIEATPDIKITNTTFEKGTENNKYKITINNKYKDMNVSIHLLMISNDLYQDIIINQEIKTTIYKGEKTYDYTLPKAAIGTYSMNVKTKPINTVQFMGTTTTKQEEAISSELNETIIITQTGGGGVICTEGEKQQYECNDGTKTDWCICANNKWNCIISPENQCPTNPPPLNNTCESGEKTYYDCSYSPVKNPGVFMECVNGEWSEVYYATALGLGPCDCNQDNECIRWYACDNHRCKQAINPNTTVECNKDTDCTKNFYTYNDCMPWYKSRTELRAGACTNGECAYPTINPTICADWQLWIQDNLTMVIIILVVGLGYLLFEAGPYKGIFQRRR